MPINPAISPLVADARDWRRDIHRHPELDYDVVRTAAFVAERLKAFGCDEVATGIGRTGVVGVIHGRGAASARTIGLRADMDALPIHETTNLRLPIGQRRQDARLRPRRPYRDAARRGALSRAKPQFLRNRGGDLPARRRRRRRRQGDARRRPDGALRHPAGLRHAQHADAADRRLRHSQGSAPCRGRSLHDHHRRARRPRRPAPRRHRSDRRRRADRHARCRPSSRAMSIRSIPASFRSPVSTPARRSM